MVSFAAAPLHIADVFYEWALNLPIIQGNSSVKFNYDFSYRDKRDIDCDIRENIINYEDEGGGEGDQTGYDLSVLRMMSDGTPALHAGQPNKMMKFSPHDAPDIQTFLQTNKVWNLF